MEILFDAESAPIHHIPHFQFHDSTMLYLLIMIYFKAISGFFMSTKQSY